MKSISSILYLSFAVLSATAQTTLSNSGILYVSNSSDIMYVKGTLSNTSAAALTNNGRLYVTSTLTNDQNAMAVGTGTLYLVGGSAQSVTGTRAFRTYHLNSDNAAGITLNNDLEVSGTHTFVNGDIISSATPNYLVYQPGASYTGDGDSRHVNGWVKKKGNTDFVFPLGNGVVERTVSVNSLSATSEFNAHYYENTFNTNNLLAPLVAVDPYEYWQVDKISGGNASINLNWDVSKKPFPNYPLGSIRASYYTAGLWTNVGGSAVGDPLVAGNISSSSVTNFGTFVIGSVAAALPVSFLGTYAYRKTSGTVIEWKTADERNVNHFEIEKSIDGKTFSLIGSVKSKPNTGIGFYQFNDPSYLDGKTYYRIRSVDEDGKYLFSRVVTVTEGRQDDDRMTIANPVTSRIYISVTGLTAGTYDYQLHTEAGQAMQKGVLKIDVSGTYSISLAGSIRPGIYVLSISSPNFSKHEKLRIL